MSKLDILFMNQTPLKAYQDLSKIHSTIETPIVVFIISSEHAKGYKVSILDSIRETFR